MSAEKLVTLLREVVVLLEGLLVHMSKLLQTLIDLVKLSQKLHRNGRVRTML